MPMCKDCGEVVGVGELNGLGLCSKCTSDEANLARKEQVRIDEKRINLQAEITSKTSAELALEMQKVIITTENVIDIPIEERIEVVFSEYVYGMNFIKDFFASIRDIVGGRIGSIEKPIRDTNKKIIEEMKMKAVNLGGDAVIGLKIDYFAASSILSIIAVGTVVKLKK